jgi:MoaA/NifB/PqqE/SkfB family radical SAM enzyme
MSGRSYQEICGVPDGFSKAKKAIKSLCSAGLNVELKTLALRPLLHEYDSIAQFAAEHHCPVKIDVYLGSSCNNNQLPLEQWRIPVSQIRGILNSMKNGYIRPLMHERDGEAATTGLQENIPAIPCMAGKRNFIITYDGRMLGCPTLTVFETNPFSKGFLAAWTQLKAMVQDAQPCQECVTCSDFEACYLCPANRIKETGSIALCSSYLKDLAHVLCLCARYDAC